MVRWLSSFTNKSKAYFVLRLFPSMAGVLGEAALATRGFPQWLLLCSQVPLVQLEAVAEAAHEAFAALFAHHPLREPEPSPSSSAEERKEEAEMEGDLERVFEAYVGKSLALYPEGGTPYRAFAGAVLAMAKRDDLRARVLLPCATRLADLAADLEAKVPASGLAREASALRKLLFGLMNVVPNHLLNDLLHLYESFVRASTGWGEQGKGQGQGEAAGREGKAGWLRLWGKMASELAVVLEVNADYFRKPQLAAWFQHLTANANPSHHHSKL